MGQYRHRSRKPAREEGISHEMSFLSSADGNVPDPAESKQSAAFILIASVNENRRKRKWKDIRKSFSAGR
jgi:hypothetical protein